MVWVLTVLALCAGYWLFQIAFLIPFLLQLRRPPQPPPETTKWPKMFISMPLRGADEGLEHALQCILDQDYPDFELRIVIDHECDSAWEVVRRFIARTDATNIRPTTLHRRRENCSLLCSSLTQVLEDLAAEDGLLTFCAAGMHPPRNWLREMASLMADPSVGATLGNRCYFPPSGDWGSLVQYLWNAGAIVPMWQFEMPWGGALALRLKDIRATGIAEKWGHGMVEDAPIKNAVQELGLRLAFSPQLFVVDRSEATLAQAWQFIYRQLLWTRLYHPHWNMVLANAAFPTAVMLAPFVVAAVSLFAGQVTWMWTSLGIGVGYILGNAVLAYLLDRSIRQVLHRRGEETRPFSGLTWLKLCLAIPVAQLIHATATLLAAFTRHVQWRGIRYRLDGPWNVRMLEYQPYPNPGSSVMPTSGNSERNP